MGRLFVEYVKSDRAPKYVCVGCGCDMASEEELVWEGFMNMSTPALLFRKAVNVRALSRPREEALSTGGYTLVDVGCRSCSLPLGWEYLRAERQDQQYKVGCCLVHQASLMRVNTKTAAAAAPSPEAPQALDGPAAEAPAPAEGC